MAIKVSTLLSKNTVLSEDNAPELGANLNTGGFSIINGVSPVDISGNKYPTTHGLLGQVLTTNGAGDLSFTSPSPANLLNENISLPITSPVAMGANSIALGEGAETSILAPNSLSIGRQALARIQGGVVQANGRFASNGDAQTGRYLLRAITISTMPTELFINGNNGNTRIILSDDSTWTFKITIAAHRVDSDDGHAGFTATGVIYRKAGSATISIQGSIHKVVLARTNPQWDINIEADTIYGSLRITVIGETNKVIRWLALVETVEITN